MAPRADRRKSAAKPPRGRGEILPEFALSDAPIHRIHMLSRNLLRSLQHVGPFQDCETVFFVRRDFETDPTGDVAVWFNPVFNTRISLDGVREVEETHVRAALELYRAQGAPGQRAAQHRAADFLASGGALLDPVRCVHAILEIFSRLPYSGLVPGHVIGLLKDQQSTKRFEVFAVNYTKAVADKRVSLYGGDIGGPCASGPSVQLPLRLAALPDQQKENFEQLLQFFQGPDEDCSLDFMAIPLFEFATRDGGTLFNNGALLGVVFFLLRAVRSKGLEELFGDFASHASSIAPLMNRFAADLLDSEFRDLLREQYTSQTPEEFVCGVLGRIDGWEARRAARHEAAIVFEREARKLTINVADEISAAPAPPICISLRPHPGKACVRFPTSAGGGIEYELALARRVRGYYQRARFLAQERRIEALEKHKQMLELLSDPLHRLSESLESMQNDAQELRAILYDPPQTLFKTHQLIAPLFDEGREIDVTDSIKVRAAHKPSDYDGSHGWESDGTDGHRSQQTGAMVLAVALCRIFGVEGCLGEAGDFQEVLKKARHELDQKSGRPAYGDLRHALLSLWRKGPDPKGGLGGLLETAGRDFPAHGADMLEWLKRVIVDPFKADAEKWYVLALEVALRPYWKDGGAKEVQKEGGGWRRGDARLALRGATPARYSSVLDFLIQLSSSRDSRRLDGVRVALEESRPDGDCAVCRLEFSEGFEDGRPLEEDVRILRDLLDPVLAGLRDWRLSGSPVGNWRGPFVDLANRLLGVRNSRGRQIGEARGGGLGRWEWEAVTVEAEDVKSVMRLRSGAGRTFGVRIWDDGGKGVLEMEWGVEKTERKGGAA